MALSNWDTLSVDENSNSTNGVFESPLGVRVEIYKNWLYVQDEKAWQEGGWFVHPTVMQVEKGSVKYKDVEITAIRGPQGGVYCVVESIIYPPRIEVDCTACGTKAAQLFHQNNCPNFVDTARTAMVGCGVYGYAGSEWIGVSEESKQFLMNWISGKSTSYIHLDRALYKPGTTDQQIIAHAKSREQVVTKKDDGELYIVHESPDFEEHITKIDLAKALRFNQGDAYFADKGGFDVPATAPGEAQPTVLSQIIDGMKTP